ncbi:hypothetical protein AB6813_18400 [bacterium RCC_150]
MSNRGPRGTGFWLAGADVVMADVGDAAAAVTVGVATAVGSDVGFAAGTEALTGGTAVPLPGATGSGWGCDCPGAVAVAVGVGISVGRGVAE